MHGSSEPSDTPRSGLGALWPLALIVLLLLGVPAAIANRGSQDASLEQRLEDGPVLAVVDSLIDASQKSTIFAISALALLYFRRLIPALWSLIHQSISGLIVALEFGVIFWFV
jgi:hypothetical protein